MMNDSVQPQPRERKTLPPLPKTRRRIPVPWGYVFIALVIGTLLCFPVYMIGKGIFVASNLKEGNIAFDREQYDVARDKFFSAMEWSGETQEPYEKRLQIAKRTGDIEAGIVDFSTIIAGHPERYLPYCYRAEAYRALQQDSLALQDYYACLDRQPDRTWAYASEQAIIVLENRGVTLPTP